MWTSVNPVSSRWRSTSSTSSSAVNVYAWGCFWVAANAQNLHFTRQTFVWFTYRFWTKKTSSVPPRTRRARSASSPSASRSSDSRSASPSSKPSRSPASTFSRIASSVLTSTTVMPTSPLPVDDDVRERLQFRLVPQELPRLPSVVEGHRPGPHEGAGCGHAHERLLLRAAGERLPYDRVLARREDQRQRRHPLAQVGTRDLARIDRVAGAVEDVVRDLERHPERESEPPDPRIARAEEARGFEELPRLQRDSLDVRVDRRLRIVQLSLLHRLATGDRQAGAGEDVDALEVARVGELGHRPCEEVVATRSSGSCAVFVPRRGAAAAELRPVDEVVVHERRDVRELDGDAGTERLLAVAGREVDEQRPETLAAGVDGVPADGGDDPRAALDGSREPLLELVEVGSGFLQNGLGGHALRLPSGVEARGAIAT